MTEPESESSDEYRRDSCGLDCDLLDGADDAAARAHEGQRCSAVGAGRLLIAHLASSIDHRRRRPMRATRPTCEGFSPVGRFGVRQRLTVVVNRNHATESVHQKLPSATHAVITVIVGITGSAARQPLDCEEMPNGSAVRTWCSPQAPPRVRRRLRSLDASSRRGAGTDTNRMRQQPRKQFQHRSWRQHQMCPCRESGTANVFHDERQNRAKPRNARIAK